MQAFNKPVLALHAWFNAVRAQEWAFFIERNADLQLFLFFFRQWTVSADGAKNQAI